MFINDPSTRPGPRRSPAPRVHVCSIGSGTGESDRRVSSRDPCLGRDDPTFVQTTILDVEEDVVGLGTGVPSGERVSGGGVNGEGLIEWVKEETTGG